MPKGKSNKNVDTRQHWGRWGYRLVRITSYVFRAYRSLDYHADGESRESRESMRKFKKETT